MKNRPNGSALRCSCPFLLPRWRLLAAACMPSFAQSARRPRSGGAAAKSRKAKTLAATCWDGGPRGHRRKVYASVDRSTGGVRYASLDRFVERSEARPRLRPRPHRGPIQRDCEGVGRQVAGGRSTSLKRHPREPRTSRHRWKMFTRFCRAPTRSFPKHVFIVSGHFDSRPSDVQDTKADAPGADDDAIGRSRERGVGAAY